jgi:hypothetical protein
MSVTPVFTPAHLFAEIGPCEFDDYHAFEATVVEHFDAHVLDFPSGYRFRDLVDWALQRQVVRREGHVIQIAPRGAVDREVQVDAG